MKENKKPIYVIQLLRGLAIFFVFLSHNNLGLNRYDIFYTTWLGAIGVELFLIISGFLLLENHNDSSIQFTGYILHKIGRFGPLHCLTLVFSIPIVGLNWKVLPLNLLLFQSFVPISRFFYSFNSVSWYLSVTLCTVVISPLILRFWKSIKEQWVFPAIIVIIFLEWLLCFWVGGFKVWTGNNMQQWILYIFPPTRCLDFMLGGGVWRLLQSKKAKNPGPGLLCSAAVLLALIAVSLFSSSGIFFVCLWTAPCAVFLYYAVQADPSSV